MTVKASVVQEPLPVRLSVNVKDPAGRMVARWGQDGADAGTIHSGLHFTSTIPGGFEHGDMVLTRNPRFDYPDLGELETLTVRGVGGRVAWEGRLETTPRTSGDHMAIDPSAVGWQSALTDHNGVRELFVVIDLSQWQTASVQRRLNLLNGNVDLDDGAVNPDASTGIPSLGTILSSPWSREHAVESWYDAKGLAIGSVRYSWKRNDAINVDPTDTHWNWLLVLSSDDVASSYDTTGNLRAAGPGSGTLTATVARPFALVQLDYSAAWAGSDTSQQRGIYWTGLALYGNQGLPLYTSLNGTQGVLASDVLAYSISKYAPQLATSYRGQSTITPSAYVIPQLAVFDPITLADLIKQATRFELQDWAVWEDRAFWLHARGYGPSKRWRARVAPTQLRGAGPQVDRVWNGVIVSFTDVVGVTRTVGPPGSNAQTTDSTLLDADPANPANQFFPVLPRYATLSLGTGTALTAIQVGRLFLQQTKLANRSGSAVLIGHVEDASGVLWPAWMPRAGDYISFIDADDVSYRRIVSTDYSDDAKSNQITLDTPPDSLKAILERLGAVLTGTGF